MVFFTPAPVIQEIAAGNKAGTVNGKLDIPFLCVSVYLNQELFIKMSRLDEKLY